MKNVMKVFLIAIMVLFVYGQEAYTKTKSYQIGPGTYYTEYTHPRPWVLQVVEIDASNPYITFESVKANDDLFSFEGPSSMSHRNNRPGHEVLTAINGDYYNTATGEPISTQAVNGEFVSIVNNTRTTISINKYNKPTIVRADYSGSVLARDSANQWISYPLANVNADRGNNQLLMYNKFWRSSTGTNDFGNECVAQAIDEWLINDTVRCVIGSKKIGAGNSSIPNNKLILSGDGTAAAFIADHFDMGDTIRIVQSLANNLSALTQVVGGGPHMLKDGIDVVNINQPIEKLGVTHCSYRHPRTAVGFNSDSTRIYFVVVDGRQEGYSVGMSLFQLADFMHQIGVQHAINLDGGGSSAMIVRNSIINRPSGSAERKVSNGLLCVSSAPRGNMEHLQFTQDSLAVFKNAHVNTCLMGWDEHYNPVGISSWDSISVIYDKTKGKFSENIFTANESEGNSILTAELNGETDSVLIHIIELYDLEIYPKTITTDSLNAIRFEIYATNEAGGRGSYNNEIFEFTVLDPTIASVNESGEFIGKKSGGTKVVVRYGEQTDTTNVYVEIGSGEVVVDELESLDKWTISSDEYINDAETSVSLCDRIAGTGTKAIKIDYSQTGNDDGNIYLERNPIDLYGVPSSILIDVLSDSNRHWIYILLEDNRGVEYSVKSSASLTYNDDYRTQYLDLKNLLPADGEQLYPLKIKGIRLRITKKATKGTMYIDRIRIIYPTWTAVEDHQDNVIPQDFKLLQNYPNPFNPTTTLSYELSKDSHVDLSIYDLKGKKINTLINDIRSVGVHSIRFNAADLPAGVYFYRLQTNNWSDTKKMLLIK